MSERKKCILIVDDERIHRIGIRDRLRHAGYDVVSAEGGEEALALIEERQNYALIVLDLLMPQPNGFEVFRHLQKKSVTSRIPILILTVVVRVDARVQELVDHGASYLHKDEIPERLVEMVHELIGPPQIDSGSA